MLDALRIRDFRLLWIGGFISSLGSWLLTIAVPAHVLLVTGSLRATGLTLAAEYIPFLLLGPVSGVVADRFDRRRRRWAALSRIDPEEFGIAACEPKGPS